MKSVSADIYSKKCAKRIIKQHNTALIELKIFYDDLNFEIIFYRKCKNNQDTFTIFVKRRGFLYRNQVGTLFAYVVAEKFFRTTGKKQIALKGVKKMQFSKWSGCGNDFIIVMGPEAENVDAVSMCNRQNGIGADGVVVLKHLKDNDFSMRIINSDGSEAGMCGNASRCAARFICQRKLAHGSVFHLHTISRTVTAEVKNDGKVTVNMGVPKEFLGTIQLEADGNVFEAETVDMGNPHAVIFVNNMQNVDLEKWGPVLEHDPQFPDRCNIEFVEFLAPGKLRMRVWERGCGITAACGTGSCAALIAAQKRKLADHGAEILLDGGSLFIRHDLLENIKTPVFMTGDATEIFNGEL